MPLSAICRIMAAYQTFVPCFRSNLFLFSDYYWCGYFSSLIRTTAFTTVEVCGTGSSFSYFHGSPARVSSLCCPIALLSRGTYLTPFRRCSPRNFPVVLCINKSACNVLASFWRSKAASFYAHLPLPCTHIPGLFPPLRDTLSYSWNYCYFTHPLPWGNFFLV